MTTMLRLVPIHKPPTNLSYNTYQAKFALEWCTAAYRIEGALKEAYLFLGEVEERGRTYRLLTRDSGTYSWAHVDETPEEIVANRHKHLCGDGVFAWQEALL